MLSKKHGWTLVELVVVVLIIGVLVAVALPQYQRAIVRVENREAVLGMRTIGRGIELYDLMNGPLPEEKSGDFSILDISVEKSKYWNFYFHCYDEFKDCAIFANPTRELAVGEHDYYLSMWVRKGILDPEIQVHETVFESEEDDGEGGTISTWTSFSADEAMCKHAGGTRLEVTDGYVCILQ